MKDTRFIAILLIISAFLFFFGLGNMALTDPDETFYAQTAKEMLASGDWVTPTIFGQPQFEKPVFYYWMVMLGYLVFGVGEFAARFPSAIFGIAGVLGVYFLARKLFSSPLCGFLSGIVTATSAIYVVLARGCVTDMTLMVFILLCFLFFLRGWLGGGSYNYYVSSVMAALAVLTKGPIGLLIPAAAVFFYVLYTRQWKKLWKVPIGWCIVIFLAVSAPWYVMATRAHGMAFINEFFGFQNITRFLHPEHRIGSTPFFYVPIVIAEVFPWSIFLLFGAWDMYRDRGFSTGLRSHKAFLLIWFLVVFLFFSVSRTKLVTYIFPIFPVLAIVVGRFWERFISAAPEDKDTPKRMAPAFYIFLISSIAAAIGLCFFIGHEYPQGVTPAIILAAIFTGGILLSAMFFLRREKESSFYLIIASVILLAVPLVIYVLPIVEEYESSKAVSLYVKEHVSLAEALGGECDHRRGIAFYSDRTDIVDIHPYGSLHEFILREDRVWGIVQEKHYNQIKNDGRYRISEPLFQSGEYIVFHNKPAGAE